MVPPPGTLLEPAEVQIGALVDARDDSGIWYRARVIDKTGRGARTSVTVRFQRFNQKHDRKFKKSHKAIRVRLSSAALRAEQDVWIYEGGRELNCTPPPWSNPRRPSAPGPGGAWARERRNEKAAGCGGERRRACYGRLQGPSRLLSCCHLLFLFAATLLLFLPLCRCLRLLLLPRPSKFEVKPLVVH